MSFAETLVDAENLFPNDKRFDPIRAKCLAVPPKQNMQAELYKIVFAQLFSDAVPSLVCRRLATLCPILPVLLPSAVSTVRPWLERVGPTLAFAALRTWTSGWTTSHRMHETPISPCLYGCSDAQDSLCHYIDCGRLWRSFRFVAQTPIWPLQQRLGFQHRCFDDFREALLALAVVCHCYHSSRFEHFGPFDTLRASNDTNALAAKLHAILRASLATVSCTTPLSHLRPRGAVTCTGE